MSNEQLSFLDVIGKNTGKTKEDEAIEKTLDPKDEISECPYNICDGHGMIRKHNDNGATYVEFCQCYDDSVLTQKLKNAKISSKFIDKDFNFDDGKTTATVLKPKEKVDDIKIKKGKTKQESLLEEDPNLFIKRHYTTKVEKRKLGDIFQSFSEKNLKLFEQGNKVANLLFFGEPGNGKTTIACLIGKYYLEQGKKVYFSTTEEFLNHIYDNKLSSKEIAKQYDLLILDEFSDEYHTDSKWAKKQIKDILKIRDELNLMTICTSNYNPKEFSLIYGDSIMSLLKGTFFTFFLERDGDGRVEKMQQMFDDFGF